MRMSRRPNQLVLALASALGFLVLLELGLRIGDFRFPPPRPPMLIWNPLEDQRLEASDGLFMRSARELWVPRPGASVPWGHADGERINSAGLRGPELELEKSPGVLRVAVLGDSSTFGMGVPFRETYGARLCELLQQRGIRAEVLDAGVIGYTVAQGLERYLALVRDYRPDVVIAAFGAVNEHLATPDFEDRVKIADSAAHFGGWKRVADGLRENLRVLHLASKLVERYQGVDRGQLADELIARRKEMKRLEPTQGEVDWPGTRRVSLERFRECLGELCSLARADGARVILISMPRHAQIEKDAPVLLEYNRAVAEVAQACGAQLCDARAAVLDALAHGTPWNALFGDHYHPSARGHALFAEKLAELASPER